MMKAKVMSIGIPRGDSKYRTITLMFLDAQFPEVFLVSFDEDKLGIVGLGTGDVIQFKMIDHEWGTPAEPIYDRLTEGVDDLGEPVRD